MNFSHREKMILKQLSQNYPKYVTLEELSSTLGVSLRTIQRDIKQLQISLKPFDVKVVKRQNKGITLKHEQLLQVVEDILMGDHIDLNQIGRVIAIYQEFMFNDDFSTSNYLSEKLGVSVYTINQDIELLSEMLSNAHLVLRKKPGVGLELEGNEKDKRNGFVHLMTYYFQQENSFSIETSEFKLFELQNDASRLMKSTQKVLFQEVKKLPFSFADNSLYDLWMYLVISILRQGQHPVEQTKYVNDINQESSAAIYQRLGFEHRFEVNELEVRYFASLFRSAKRVNEVIDIETDNLVTLASELITYVASSTGYYIEQSPQFLHGLISHLRPLINRLREGVFVGNPIKDKIKADYPQLFLSIKHYFNQYSLLDISDDEIGFLTLHFGVNIESLKAVPNVRTLVICTSGIATSRMLTKRLLDSFPQMTIIEQSSLLELTDLNMDEYDLIISAVKLSNPAFDYIYVNPMLEQKDYQQIEEKVNQILMHSRGVKKIEAQSVNLDDQLLKTEELVDMSKQFIKNFQVLKTNYLSYDNFIDDLEVSDALKKDLIQKQNKFGFAIPNSNIALVHTRSDDVDEIMIRVYQNRSDMVLKGMANKNEKVDTLLLLVTPQELSNEQLELISFVSVTLLEAKYVKIYSEESEATVTDFIKSQLSHSLTNTLKKIWR